MPKRSEFWFDSNGLNLNAAHSVNSAAHVEAITAFLLSAESLVPEMLEELRDISPFYTPTVGRTLWSWWPPEEWWKLLAKVDNEECHWFYSALSKWANKYHLDEDATGTLAYLHMSIRAIGSYVMGVMWENDLPAEFFAANAKIPEEVNGFTEGKMRLALQKALMASKKSNHPKLSLAHGIDFTPALSRAFFEDQYPFKFIPTFQDVRSHIKKSNRHKLDSEEVIASSFSPEAPINQRRRAAFDPQRDDWDDFENAVDELFEDYKQQYKNQIHEWRRQSKYEVERLKTKREHFEWFVLFHIRGMSYEEISQFLLDQDIDGDIGAAPDTIRKQIPLIASLLGISSKHF
ncbi:hypothetical protein [Alicyclobacillus sp. SO9]|uniref:hypothetical protein n=1 Tax=Alicyclobacillus sp. SO9 TaxID=2665646 RepID=UPI0018E6F61F|nr:hypothetical protein [Alicyclobacillus sp. SO9]QQE81568.1 hypothetical protein GI364_24545 [Alicyclobacillus sp. SO9]